MKLTTTDTTRYGDLRVKVAAGTATPADTKAYEALVRKMGKPEPRKKKKRASAGTAAPAAAKQSRQPPAAQKSTTKKKGAGK